VSTLGEDACLTRTNNRPSNRALCNNLLLALIIRQHRFASVPQALRHFNRHRQAAQWENFEPTKSVDSQIRPPWRPAAADGLHRPIKIHPLATRPSGNLEIKKIAWETPDACWMSAVRSFTIAIALYDPLGCSPIG